MIMREADPTVRGAKLAEKAGADIIVATGCDELMTLFTSLYILQMQYSHLIMV